VEVTVAVFIIAKPQRHSIKSGSADSRAIDLAQSGQGTAIVKLLRASKRRQSPLPATDFGTFFSVQRGPGRGSSTAAGTLPLFLASLASNAFFARHLGSTCRYCFAEFEFGLRDV
jgi:hypothetical protein